jgi:hypothetical protein
MSRFVTDEDNTHYFRLKQAHLTPEETKEVRMQSLDIDSNSQAALVAGPKTLSVPAAGRIYFELGRNASYAAAARGEIPTVKVGSRLRVPVLALERMLQAAG